MEEIKLSLIKLSSPRIPAASLFKTSECRKFEILQPTGVSCEWNDETKMKTGKL